MKNWMFLSMTFALLPLSMMAQDDDMYFGSAKKSKSSTRITSTQQTTPDRVYHSGSRRSVDDYNRRGSSYETLPNDSDIIDFSAVEGVYPDSTADYQMTKKMARWDGYTPSDAYWEGYSDGSHDSWMWHSPWFSSYYSWYDSWYYPYWHYGWYDPWYYDYGWGYYPYYHYPYYRYSYHGGYYGSHHYGTRYYGTGNTGTLARSGNYSRSTTHGNVTSYTSSSRFDGARNRAYSGNSGRATSGSSTRSGTRTTTSRSSTRTVISGGSYNNSSYSNSSSGSSLTPSRSSSSSYSGGGGYSGGGSRSGGYSGGGTRSGGGAGGRTGGGRR